MNLREEEIKRIRSRMKELGYNQRSLSMKLFNKPDRVRNYLAGKSQNPRADTYKAIIKELWPSSHHSIQIEQKNDFSHTEIGLIKSFKALIEALINQKTLNPRSLESLLNANLREFRRGVSPQQDAIEVTLQLLDSLHSGPFLPTPPTNRKSPEHLPAQYQKEINSDKA